MLVVTLDVWLLCNMMWGSVNSCMSSPSFNSEENSTHYVGFLWNLVGPLHMTCQDGISANGYIQDVIGVTRHFMQMLCCVFMLHILAARSHIFFWCLVPSFAVYGSSKSTDSSGSDTWVIFVVLPSISLQLGFTCLNNICLSCKYGKLSF